jgi:hypothetical protein
VNLLKLQANKFEAGSTSSPSLAKIGNIANVSEQDQQLGCESSSICIIIIIINNLLFHHQQSSPENQTLQQHLEACSLKDLRLCPLKSMIIVFEFSRI